MIVRIWHGWTGRGEADAFQELLEAEVVPGTMDREVPGLQGVDVLRREPADTDGDGEVEFVTVMTFEDWASVEAFAGPDRTAAVVPEAARALLRRFDAEVRHYELLARFS